MHFVLEVERLRDGIRGSVTPEGGHRVAFVGWLELIDILDDVPDRHEESTNP